MKKDQVMGSITNISLLNISLLMMFSILFSHSALSKKEASFNSSSTSKCIESELRALMEFRASLVNDSSSLLWTGRDCCSWYGITCHSLTGHVQNLELVFYNFDSSLSPWLFNLTNLEVLNVGFAGLTDVIPNMFEKLTSLTYLDISWNDFNPATFPDSLCSLTSLTHMDLSSSRLQGSLPSCLANLTSLTELYLGSNELSGEIPGGLGFLTHLSTLDLSDNCFNSSIPSTFGNLQELEYLYLHDNQLSGTIPSTLGNLTNLTNFNVSSNFLIGELSEIFFKGLGNLQELDISSNRYLVLNVSPQWIPSFQMSIIFMNSVFIGTSFPSWLQTQRNLERLSMSNTGISGAIPDWFLTAFPSLTYFNASNNLLNSSIHVGNRTIFSRNLINLDLSDNLLSGTIPTFHSTAPLQSLKLSGNQFSGNIPYPLCNLTTLFVLCLGNNHLTGVVPTCVGASEVLIVLNLGNNSLSGLIPSELGSSRLLYILHLNGNKFSGEIPASFRNFTSLKTLDLGQNELHGSIPTWIGKNWSNLQYLRLESNNFFGEIPVNLCQLPSLHILNLALNNLVGTIPSCLGNLSKMLSSESGESIHSDVYSEALLNFIKGREMMYTSSLPYCKFISLSGNYLHGEIPTELMNLKWLQSLNLSKNDLTGMIPENINNLRHLEALDLSMNRLSGTIPQSLADIDALSYLNLSFNSLVGRIPSGNHFDTLDDPSIYEGNVGLCGKLLMMSCEPDNLVKGDVSDVDVDVDANIDEEFDLLSWLYAGIGPGFAVGFVGVMSILYFKDPWRVAYFGFVDNLNSKVRATLTGKISQILSKFN